MTHAPHNGYPENPQGGNKYGTAGYNPDQNFEMTKPPQVNRLFQMTMASLLLFLLINVLSIAALFQPGMRDTLATQLEESGQALPQGMSMDEFVTFSQISGAITFGILVLLGVVIYALVLLGIKKRWGWARILGIIAAIIGVIYALWTIIASLGATVGVLDIIAVLLTVVFAAVGVYWLILAFNGQVAAWLARRG